MVHAPESAGGNTAGRTLRGLPTRSEPVEQRAVVGGRRSIRRYCVLFDHLGAAVPDDGPGRLVRSSRITDSWGMRPRLDEDPGWRRTLDWFSIVYIYHGSGSYHGPVGEQPRPITAGDVICLFPGVPHAYAPAVRDRWDEINIDFVGRAFDAWRGPGLLDPSEPIRHLEPVPYWLHQFEQLVVEVAGGGGSHGLRDTGRLLELIARMTDDWRPDADKATAAWLEEVKDRLDTEAAEVAMNYEAIAARFGLGEQAFRKKFRRLTGLTPAQYRGRRLIERACLLLEQTENTGREIARQLGFESEFYFSRRFKQMMGISPSDYRNRVGHGGPHSVVEPRRRGGGTRIGRRRPAR